MSAPESQSEKCDARTRSGRRCSLPKGWGTDHVGFGACKLHGGSTPNHRKAAARQVAISIAGELNVTPEEALLTMVRRAAALQAYWQAQVEALDLDEQIVTYHRRRAADGDDTTSYLDTSSAATLHVAIQAEHEAIDRLERISKTALAAGIAERQVRVAEMVGGRLAAAFGIVLDHFGLREHPDAPEVMRRALAELEAG